MNQTWRSLFLMTLPLAILGCLASSNTARAQITPDKTLGSESSVVTPNILINGVPSDRIDGGATRGNNLFHSFQDFNINAGRGAYFSNPGDINNIISRVTGGNPSNIFGTLGVLGKANLFFINPNGIIFGSNARLDLNGSFLASTANSLIFNNGFEFSATNPQAPPLLTVNIPIGLRFRDNPGMIQVQGDGQGLRSTTGPMDTTAGLRVQPNQTLALVGGDFSLEGGTLKTAGGRIELGSVAGDGLVNITPIDKGFSLGYGEIQNFGNIQLSKQSAVDASGEGGGDIQVWGRNVTLTDGSQIEASTLGAKSGGTLIVNAQDSVQLIGTSADANFSSALFTQAYSGTTGSGGNLTVKTRDLLIQNGGRIDTSTAGKGNAGNITINAKGAAIFDGVDSSGNYSSLFSDVQAGAVGNGGTINITAESLSLTNGGEISTTVDTASDKLAAGRGIGGTINVKVGDALTISGTNSQGIFANLSSGAVGSAGNINVEAGSVLLKDGAQINSFTSGQGNAGNVVVNATKNVSLDGKGSAIFSTVGGVGDSAEQRNAVKGNGGNIEINTPQLSLSNGAQLSASTFAQGNAGNLVINATNSVSLDGYVNSDGQTFPSGIFSTVGDVGDSAEQRNAVKGNGGNIEINTSQLSLSNGAQIRADIDAQGDSGNVIINATNSVSLDGYANSNGQTFPSAIFSSVGEGGDSAQVRNAVKGNGGNIEINTSQLSLSNGAQLEASTYGQGNAGNVVINATKSVSLDGSDIYSYVGSGGVGNGGDINISATQLSMSNGAQLSASTYAQGNAGDIKIIARDTAIFDGYNSRITSNVPDDGLGLGNSGKIDITASSLALTNGAQVGVSVRKGEGNAGNITINANSARLDSGQIFAETVASGNGGDVILKLSDYLLLRRGSQISTTAGINQARGNGGNITINSPLIVAFPLENSDITANAFTGKGGRVNITTQGIFGIKPLSRTQLERLLNTTDPSQLDPSKLPTSDITAISQQSPSLSGTVTINSPEVDPSKGLIQLPENVIDPTQQIAQNPCKQSIASSEFISTGRGGLPPSPNEALSNEGVRSHWIEATSTAHSLSQETKPSQASIPNPKPQTLNQVVPAQGWVFNNKGQVVLTAYDPTSNGSQRSRVNSGSCPAR
ncbi:S-layer family protein [Aetokthonos hydrillicola Thurmond2011]|uniref:S-layer family protein n=1 Tax=Aetokthonos hydrillicola Thurmond2011 TaxID=2712845 RepID=A0AAP5I6D5_9CYAN|nr:S-layer family protein [Aetokthonos hydrillicola]MBO3457341.1 S-layer family protein [Aetokthonos hydrillicola CCALA 1050]MBW4586690.1 S-layer family protein [Aetokthonos hydrillicola CCALA 1050]MDR9893983.1 S-layer family protein [Aetokthonos hydrillicola Thurmond2011]